MKLDTVAVVGGPEIWSEYFPNHNLVYVKIDNSRWQLNDSLSVYTDGQFTTVDGILWRLGPIRPRTNHRALLEIIRQSEVPSVNSPDVLLKGYDRLSMLYEMKRAGLPVIDFQVVIGENVLWAIDPDYPFVIKFGNYHGGYGKLLVRDASQWSDVRDTAFLIEDYITIEPYIEYTRDIRCLMVGEEIFCTSRQGMLWKANSITTQVDHIRPPDELVEYTHKAMEHLGADILGLDFLETMEGDYVLLESNDIPGIKEYPDTARQLLVDSLIGKMK